MVVVPGHQKQLQQSTLEIRFELQDIEWNEYME